MHVLLTKTMHVLLAPTFAAWVGLRSIRVAQVIFRMAVGGHCTIRWSALSVTVATLLSCGSYNKILMSVLSIYEI